MREREGCVRRRGKREGAVRQVKRRREKRAAAHLKSSGGEGGTSACNHDSRRHPQPRLSSPIHDRDIRPSMTALGVGTSLPVRCLQPSPIRVCNFLCRFLFPLFPLLFLPSS